MIQSQNKGGLLCISDIDYVQSYYFCEPVELFIKLTGIILYCLCERLYENNPKQSD